MSSLCTAFIALICLGGGLVIGAVIRSRLPDHHLHDDSRDVLKLASGVIATLVALVFGLLVNSSKSSYDRASMGVTQIGAQVILLDWVLRRYGPETKAIRGQLGRGLVNSIDRLWPRALGANPDLTAIERATNMEEVQERIARLESPDEPHRSLRTRALCITHDLVRSRWLMIEQAQTALPTTFLAMPISWLTVLLTSPGLLAPPETRRPRAACWSVPWRWPARSP